MYTYIIYIGPDVELASLEFYENSESATKEAKEVTELLRKLVQPGVEVYWEVGS